MSNTNLIIICDGIVVFSNIFKKRNGLPLKIDLSNMIDVVNGRFIIPISEMGMYSLFSTKRDPSLKDEKSTTGPSHVTIYFSTNSETAAISEFSITDEIEVLPVPNWRDSWYCRSNNYEAESAATAGLFIEKNPLLIYLETYNAIGENRPPYYSGFIDDIVTGTEQLKQIEVRAKKAEDDKTLSDEVKKEINDRCVNEYKKAMDDLPAFLKLTYIE